MMRRTKLHWTEFSRQVLRDGIACNAGGAQVLLLMSADRKGDETSARLLGLNCGAEPEAVLAATGQPR